MSEADALQMKHNLRSALRERLRLIVSGQATWHDYHQAGVLTSELAELLWQATGSLTLHSQWTLLQQAINFFNKALNIAQEEDSEENTNGDLVVYSILCDSAMAAARLARTTKDPVTGHDAIELIGGNDEGDPGIRRHLAQAVGEHPGFAHQAAIAGALEFRLRCGSIFSFTTPPQVDLATKLQDDTLGRFQGMLDDASPDGENTYRSFLLYAAMFEGWLGNWQRRQALAFDALGSAWQHRDTGHGLRAIAILVGGRPAHRVLSALRFVKEML